MDLDALKNEWQLRGAPGPEWTRGEDVTTLRERLARLRRIAAARDVREAAAAVLVAALFTWMAVRADHALERAGAIVVVAAAIFMMLWARVAGGGNRGPAADLPVAEFFQHERRYLDRQIHLLRSVLWWYILPNLVGVQLFFLGSGGWTRLTAMFMLLPLAVAVGVYVLNRRAARTELQPLRDEVDRLLRELQANGHPS